MAVLTTATVTVSIDAPFEAVVADLADASAHPMWATEFFEGPARPGDSEGEVLVNVPMMGGEARMRVDAQPESGVVDLYLAPARAPYGPPIPVRVVRNADGADVLFTLARLPGTEDDAWTRGLASLGTELANLKERLEGRSAQ